MNVAAYTTESGFVNAELYSKQYLSVQNICVWKLRKYTTFWLF